MALAIAVVMTRIRTLDQQEIKMKANTKYIILKIVIVLVASIIMLFASMFNMLSKEQIATLLNENPLDFYFSKFKISFFIGLFFLLISLIINWLLRKKTALKKIKRNLTLIEFAYYVLFAILTVMIFIKSIN